MKKTLDEVLRAKRESKYVEFKGEFDVGAVGDWCEILKDIVAIANSGGGAIAFGLDNNGQPTGEDVSAVLDLDPARLTDKINKYTGIQFSDFRVEPGRKQGRTAAVLLLGSSEMPMVFTRPGAYALGDGKRKIAFRQGTVYFRHGAKSEPGTTGDLRDALERRLAQIRDAWMRNVTQVIEAEHGSHIRIYPPRFVGEAAGTPVHVVDDPAEAAYGVVDTDTTHPFRQTEVIAAIRKQLPRNIKFNQFDVLALRTVCEIEKRRDFSHQPKFGSRQYSKKFVDWILQRYQEDGDFFSRTRGLFRAHKKAV